MSSIGVEALLNFLDKIHFVFDPSSKAICNQSIVDSATTAVLMYASLKDFDHDRERLGFICFLGVQDIII